jgi:hypothetical protein
MAAITPPPMVGRMHRAPAHMGSGDEMDFTLWAGPLPQQAQVVEAEVALLAGLDR